MLPTDWSAPASSVLRRLSDRRVQQYWDPNHVLATRMKTDAHAPQPVQDCCVGSGILWDLVAVYPPGATWSDRMPSALVFNGPVVDVMSQVESALVSMPRTSLLLSPGRTDHKLASAAIRCHKTRSVFDRYNIVSDGDLRDAARRLEEHATPPAARSRS